MPGLGFFQGPAVHADVQRLGPRNGQAAGQAGSRITHIAKATGLTQATTHRLPQSLVAKRIVEQDASSRLYRLSISFFSGREGWKRHGSAHAEPPFHAPAVWLDRDEGPFPIRSFTGDIGGRVALGVSQGSLAFPSSRLNTDRLPTVVELLKRKARAVGALVNPFNPTLRRPAQSLAPADSD